MNLVGSYSYPWQAKRGSILMVSLWVLIILSLLAVGIGWRVSTEIRFVRNQRDRLKALCLAKAGINMAIVELEKDQKKDLENPPAYDSLNETWSKGVEPETGEPLFENIEIKKGSGQRFTVRYLYKEEGGKPIYLCMADEERKININTASQELLVALLEKCQIANAEEIASNIRLWRGDQDPELSVTSDKDFKKAPLTNPEELVLVLEYFYQNKADENYSQEAQEGFNKVKDLITVYTGNKIDINTTSEDILTILANSVAKGDEEKNCLEAVVKDIIKQREEKNYFKMLDDIEIRDVVSGTSSDENLFTNLKNQLTVQSNNFKIESTGRVDNLTRKIIAIYERTNNKIVYWYES